MKQDFVIVDVPVGVSIWDMMATISLLGHVCEKVNGNELKVFKKPEAPTSEDLMKLIKKIEIGHVNYDPSQYKNRKGRRLAEKLNRKRR